jgi:hypothetical protein
MVPAIIINNRRAIETRIVVELSSLFPLRDDDIDLYDVFNKLFDDDEGILFSN